MIPLIAEGDVFMVPWPYAATICGALVSGIVYLLVKLLEAKSDLTKQQKEFAERVLSICMDALRAQTATAEQTRTVSAQLEKSDEHRVVLASEIRERLDTIETNLRTEIRELPLRSRKAGV